MSWALAMFLSQQPISQADQIREAMAASIEKQRASVMVQAQATGTALNNDAAAVADAAQAKANVALAVSHLINHLIS